MHVTQNGWTALHLAAQEGHEDVVELLLEAKADPELKKKVVSVTSVFYGTWGNTEWTKYTWQMLLLLCSQYKMYFIVQTDVFRCTN